MKNKQQGKPVSRQKLAANRNNAKRSTGPQTSQGKQRASQNSYKHGFYAMRLFPNDELLARDGEDYNRILAAFWSLYSPVGDVEKLHVELIVAHRVRLARLLGHEQKVLAWSAPFEGRSVDKIVRYESSVTRQLEKAIEQLERLQQARQAASDHFETSGLESDDAICEPVEASEEESETPEALIIEKPHEASPSSNPPDASLTTAPPHVEVNSKQGLDPVEEGSSSRLAETAASDHLPITDAQTLAKTVEKIIDPTPAEQHKSGLGSGENYGTNPPDCSRFIETAEDEELIERIKRGDFDHLEPPE